MEGEISPIPVYGIHPAIYSPDEPKGYKKCQPEEANIFIILDQHEKLYDWFNEHPDAERWVACYSLHNNTTFGKVV